MRKYMLLLLLCAVSPRAMFGQTERGVTPVSTAPSKENRGKTYAVVVGISDYQNPNITDLHFADRDAAAFAQYLKSPAGGNLDSSRVTLLLNEAATAGQFAAALDGLLEQSKEGDLVIIYFAGHGDVEKKTISQPGFLLCWDAPARVYMGGGTFGLLYLQEIITTLSVQTKAQVLVITDACRAGKLAGSSIGGTQATAANLSRQYAGEVKIMSCQPDELSLEGQAWGGGRGVFSYYLLRGMQGLADLNADNKINLLEIERYLMDQVPRAAAPHSQIPLTVGSKSTQIARVDPAVLAALKKEEAENTSTGLVASTDRGIIGALEASNDSIVLALYNDFKKAMKEGRLLYPAEGSAWALFERLKDEPTLTPFKGLMRRNLAAALQDEAQQAINDYLSADPVEMRKRWGFDARYERFPENLDKAAILVGESHFLYKSLRARQHYFAGLNQRLRGERVKNSESYQIAVAEQQKCLEWEPEAPYAFNELGLLDRRRGDYKAAATHFEQAIALAPCWVLPWANLCSVYMDMENPAEAEKAGRQAVLLDSAFALAQYNLGTTYLALSELSKAKYHFEKTIFYDPNYSDAYYNLGLACAMDGAFEQAERMWTLYHQQRPDDISCLVDLGEVSVLLHKKEQALQFYRKALDMDPAYPRALLKLGEYYLLENQLDAAEASFLRLTGSHPNNPAGYYFLANTALLQQQPEKASGYLEKAAQRDSDFSVLRKDTRLENLRNDARFVGWLEQRYPKWKAP